MGIVISPMWILRRRHYAGGDAGQRHDDAGGGRSRRCTRRGRLRIERLIAEHGSGASDLRAIIAADCPRMENSSTSIYDRCGVHFSRRLAPSPSAISTRQSRWQSSLPAAQNISIATSFATAICTHLSPEVARWVLHAHNGQIKTHQYRHYELSYLR